MLKEKYLHKEVEEGKYQAWLDNDCFKSGDQSKKPYCLVIPPPNITGKLHIGHAMDNTLQDLLVRYYRLQGYDVLWVPGTDHAGIATQAKVDERLKKQGISRYDLGRENFLKQANLWKDEYQGYIHDQWKKLGNSVDYSKERFTLDEGLSNAVKEVFVKYYKEGLIYQGQRVINWDPQAKTALSNIEVEYKDVQAKMYYIKYQLVDDERTFVVATTRPETMFADVCVVVNPKDEENNWMIGKKCINPCNGDVLEIIGDEYIEIGFGTGAMKCTPAHDPNDYQIALRHNLKMPVCMNEDATMNDLCGKYQGMDRFECREKLCLEYQEKNILIKVEDIVHAVGHSERTGVMIEPYLSKQWFVKMKPLANDVLKNQENPDTKINFYPKRFEKTFNQWLENIEDWCISRQLWWGHRIPVYYHKQTNDIYCEINPPSDIENYYQDEDVLDTWFSSALFPFSVLGWPLKTEDLKRYFPNSCMVTGYDIIFFWVARMAFSARHFLNDIPFKDCLIHGLIRDEKGRKMSKSLGNGIDPNDIIEQYGCDSLRLFISTTTSPGLDTNFSKLKIEAAWNFINKLYNASRFIINNLNTKPKVINFELNKEIDHYIAYKLNNLINSVTNNTSKYELAIAGNEIISFVWDELCSNYIEFNKYYTKQDGESKDKALNNLVYILVSLLKMLHPYIPFVTEEIYQEIFGKDKFINLDSYPVLLENIDIDKVKKVESMNQIIQVVRELKNEYNIKPSKEISLMIENLSLSDDLINILYQLTKAKVVYKVEGMSIIRPINDSTLIFKQSEIINIEEELKTIEKKLAQLVNEINRSNGILSNKAFIDKAPESKVKQEQEKLANYQEQYNKLQEKRKELTNNE